MDKKSVINIQNFKIKTNYEDDTYRDGLSYIYRYPHIRGPGEVEIDYSHYGNYNDLWPAGGHVDKMLIHMWDPDSDDEDWKRIPIVPWKTPSIYYNQSINNIINELDNIIPKDIITIIIEYAVAFDGPPFDWVKILDFDDIDPGILNWIEFSEILEYFPNVERLYINQWNKLLEYDIPIDDFYTFIKTIFSKKMFKILVLCDSTSPFIQYLKYNELFKRMSNGSVLFIGSEHIPQFIHNCNADEYHVKTQENKHIIFRHKTGEMGRYTSHPNLDTIMLFIDNIIKKTSFV